MANEYVNIKVTKTDDVGFAQDKQIPAGTTYSILFGFLFPGAQASNYSIGVLRGDNTFRPTASEIVQDGDRVMFTPKKVGGGDDQDLRDFAQLADFLAAA